MIRPKILNAFSPEQVKEIQFRLATKVIQMMGRKFEEDDWTGIYCKVKKIPNRGWSNLQLDIMHEGLGVEHKMLCYRSNTNIKDACGQILMHPSATRSIRIPESETDPNKVMASVLQQYAELIDQRTKKVIELSSNKDIQPDMRTGWFLWQESLRQFMYFEEEMLKPKPDDYYAEWVESGGGTRKTSRNLWIYDKETNKKRYSITTQAGAKIQPYFDVPSPSEKDLYIFTVIGEYINTGLVRIWLSRQTRSDLEMMLGKAFTSEALSEWIINNASRITAENIDNSNDALAEPYIVKKEIYNLLTTKMHGINDDHCIQLLIRSIK